VNTYDDLMIFSLSDTELASYHGWLERLRLALSVPVSVPQKTRVISTVLVNCLRDRRTALGQCIDCREPSNGRIRCEVCRRHASSQEMRRRRLRETVVRPYLQAAS
jgi:hypothetical protein